jgi:tRNA A37 threonylcarbamoyladenosine dehydratase
MQRLLRTQMLLGPEAVARIRRARVTVVGLGAVGSYAVEGLARAGVGQIRLVDFDEVRESNINRQLYALHSTLGRRKAQVARERVLDIQPDCQVEALETFVDGATAPQLLDNQPDALIDAIDSVSPKVRLLAAAAQLKIPVIVSSMGAANRLDPFAIRFGDISRTRQCPLARFIRKRLKKHGVITGIQCVYSIEPAKPVVAELAGVEEERSDAHRRGRPRRPLGSLACITGVFGLLAAHAVIMALAGVMREPG